MTQRTGSALHSLLATLERGETLIIDGGLATELEEDGHDLNDDLWSARMLRDDPEAIAQVHREYLKAGADIIITASYQASVPAFMRHDINREDSEQLLLKSVEIARTECDAFNSSLPPDRHRTYVAASIGPYAAYLADGSEYTGKYPANYDEIMAFHQPRWELLRSSGADLLACETIPNATEAKVLAKLIHCSPDTPAWISFCCGDRHALSDGTPVGEVSQQFAKLDNVLAIGVNCVMPQHAYDLLQEIARTVPHKPLLCYPNSGECFNISNKTWSGRGSIAHLSLARQWHQAGARLIGGCCRTGPDLISGLRQQLSECSVKAC